MRPLSDPFQVALYEPEIPSNAGSVARLCAVSGSALHLVGRLGFSFSHPAAKRAGMDYWADVRWERHVAWADFAHATAGRRRWLFSTRASRTLWEAEFSPGDVLVFGPESRGLPDDLLAASPEHCVRIPMLESARSLNLATAVGIGLFEALRQVAAPPR